MTIRLHTNRVWGPLTRAAQKCRGQALAAVPYFGKDGSRLLPLGDGDTLVVNASDAAVKSGQTCPASLRRLIFKGVRVFTCDRLHAKVYVLGRTAFIGSANVSSHSRETLAEALIETTDSRTISDAVRFISSLCVAPISVKELDRLDRLYRPPRIRGESRKLPNGQRSKRPRVHLAHIDENPLEQFHKAEMQAGKLEAREKCEHRKPKIDYFWMQGACPFRRGDSVIQVVKSKTGAKWVYTAGIVTHLRVSISGGKRTTFVYLEMPTFDWFRFETIVKRLGRGSRLKLERDGLLRDDEFRHRLQHALVVRR